MQRLRRGIAAASLAILGAGAFAAAAAGSAAATSGATSTLDCTPSTTGSGQSIMTCTATAAAGVHLVRVIDSTFGHAFTTSSRLECSSGATSNTIQFPTFFNDRYKVIVTDCQRPKNGRDTYRVLPDGTVNLVNSTGGNV